MRDQVFGSLVDFLSSLESGTRVMDFLNDLSKVLLFEIGVVSFLREKQLLVFVNIFIKVVCSSLSKCTY